MKYNLDIYVPVVPDFKFESYPFEQSEILLDEIKQVLKLKKLIDDDCIKEYEISFQIKQIQGIGDTVKIYSPKDWFLSLIHESYIHFIINVEVDKSLFNPIFSPSKYQSRNFDEKDKDEVLELVIISSFCNLIFEVLILSQIARPGSLKTRAGKAWLNERVYHNTIPKIINYREVYEYHIEKSYPKIQFLNFYNYYLWLRKNNLIFNESPVNSFQKAINNLSHISGDSTVLYYTLLQIMTLSYTPIPLIK